MIKLILIIITYVIERYNERNELKDVNHVY